MKEFLSGAVFFLLGVLAGGYFFSSENVVVETITKVEERVDTIVVEKPAEVRYKTLRETILVEARDTVTQHDTFFVRLPLEEREYRRDEFYAVVSGYDPRLTHIEVYPKTTIVTKTEMVMQKNHVSVGMELGYGESMSMPAYIEYERMLHRNVGVYGKAVRDMSSGTSGVAVGARVRFGW